MEVKYGKLERLFISWSIKFYWFCTFAVLAFVLYGSWQFVSCGFCDWEQVKW